MPKISYWLTFHVSPYVMESNLLLRLVCLIGITQIQVANAHLGLHTFVIVKICCEIDSVFTNVVHLNQHTCVLVM
jgi:hypothetical protein